MQRNGWNLGIEVNLYQLNRKTSYLTPQISNVYASAKVSAKNETCGS